MQLSGHIDKMQTSLEEGMAHYKLLFDDQQFDMNSLVGQHIEFTFNKTIQCANPECKRITPKSYSQGYCFPCARSLARCDLCIMRPETCHYHLGTCREPEWGCQIALLPTLSILQIPQEPRLVSPEKQTRSVAGLTRAQLVHCQYLK